MSEIIRPPRSVERFIPEEFRRCGMGPFLTIEICSKCRKRCRIPLHMYDKSPTCYNCDPVRWETFFKKQVK
jgi:hypothetical protein